MQQMYQNSNSNRMEPLLKTFYIIGDRVIELQNPPSRYDYRVQSSTLQGALEFLRMVQNHRERHPDTEL